MVRQMYHLFEINAYVLKMNSELFSYELTKTLEASSDNENFGKNIHIMKPGIRSFIESSHIYIIKPTIYIFISEILILTFDT